MTTADFVNLCLIRNKNGEMLVVKRKPEQGKDGAVLIWGLPGGRQKNGESREECAERKTLEQTGYKVKAIKQIAMRVHPQFPRVICQFVCDLIAENTVEVPNLEEHDLEEIKWIKPEEFKVYAKLNIDPNVLRELNVI